MASSHFGFGEIDDFNPEYGGVNWRERRDATMEAPLPVWFETECGLTKQVTQMFDYSFETTVAPELDAIAIHDPRDGDHYWYFRGIMGEEVFTDLRVKIGHALMRMVSEYPQPHVVEVYEKLCGDTVPDGIPEDW